MIWRRVMAFCGAMEMWLASPKVGSARLTGLLPSAWLFALEYPTVRRAFTSFRAMCASAVAQISGVVPPAVMAFSGPFPRSGLRLPGGGAQNRLQPSRSPTVRPVASGTMRAAGGAFRKWSEMLEIQRGIRAARGSSPHRDLRRPVFDAPEIQFFVLERVPPRDRQSTRPVDGSSGSRKPQISRSLSEMPICRCRFRSRFERSPADADRPAAPVYLPRKILHFQPMRAARR